MSDLDRFVELYKSFGIDVKVNKRGKDEFVVILAEDRYDNPNCNATTSEKIEGFEDFFTSIIFDKDGHFVKQGIWKRFS